MEEQSSAIAFWIFVAVISVTGTIMPLLKHRETQRTIRAAIEKGQPIDPSLLEQPKKEEKPENYILFGLVLIAAGLGMQVLAVAIGIQANMGTIWPVNGAGAITFFIGVALFGFGRWQMKRLGR